jgi:hypothetical protein
VNRAQLLAPDGWKPARGGRVQFLDAKDSPAPAGTWYLVDRAPDGWWCKPHDEAARRWLARHPTQAVQGHLALNGRQGAPGRRMVPAGYAPRPAG